MANPNLRMTVEARTSGEQDLSNIGAAIDRLAAKIGDLGKKSEESNNRTAASFKSLTSQLSQAFSGDALGAANKSLQNLILGFGAAGAAAAGAIEIFKQVGSAASDLVIGQAAAAREQINFATRLGITTAEGLKFSAMAKIAGVDGNSLATASRFIANALEDQSGAGKRAFEALQKLGVATRTQSGAVRDLGEVTLDAIKALGNIDDAAKRVALSSALLGRGGTKELQPLLEHYRELDRTVTQFGLSLDANATTKLSQSNDEINKLSLAWDKLRQKLAEKIEPVVISFVTRLVTAATPASGPEFNGLLNLDSSWRRGADKWLEQTLSEKFPTITQLAPKMAFDSAGAEANANRLNRLNAESSPEAIDRQISQLRREADEARAKIDKNVGIADQNAGNKELHQNEAEIRRLELLKKDMQERPQVIERLRLEGGAPGAIAQFQYRNRLAKGTPEYDRGLQEVFKKQLDAARERTRKDEDELTKLKTASDQAGNAYKDLGPADLEARSFFSSASYRPESIAGFGAPPPSAALQIARLGGTFDFNQRIRSITAAPGDEGRNAALTLAEQKQLIGQELAAKEDEIRGEKNYLTELGKISDARAEARNKDLDAEHAYTEALAQIQENRKNAFRSAVEGGTSALLSGGQRGLADFVRGKAIGLASTIAGNAADAHYGVLRAMIPTIPGQTKTDANGNQIYTAFGNLLKGTVLGAELKSPAVISTDLNTTATSLNSSAVGTLSSAVAALYNAITGQSLPGITSLGAPLSGSAIPAGGLFSATLGSGGTGGSALSSLSAFGSTVSSAGFPQIGAAIQQAASIAAIVQGGGGSLGSLDHSIATTDDVLGSGGISTNDNGLGAAVNVLKGTLSAPSQTDAIINATKGGGGPNVLGILTGSQTDSNGNVQDFSGAQRIAGGIATAGVVAQGVQQAVHGFSSGGAYGVFSGVGGAAQAAAAVDPEPVSAAALQIAAQTAKIIAAVIGDPRAAREHEISRRLFEDKYTAPTALNVTGSTYGTYSDVNENGIVRSSKFSPFPTVSEAYIDLPRRAVVPGQVLSQFGGGGSVANPGPGTHVTVNVNTMDSKSFNDNGYKIADALHGAILGEGHPVVSEIGYQLGVK